MKYIVEFEDEPCMYEDEVHFYKCIQAPWWGLSERVIKQLTPYQPDIAPGTNVGDTISRQAAIDAIAKQMPKSYTSDGSHPGDEEIYKIQEIYVDCIESIEILPAVQPDHVADISKKAEGDCISRQAAIDALHTWFRDGFNEDKWWNSTHVLAAIEGMSPAQQGYKLETCFECPLSHGCPKIKGCTNEQAIERASQIPNDCPLSAQPEQNAYEQGRITGRVEMRTEILSALKEMVGREVWSNV